LGVIFIVAAEYGAGKTSICAGVAINLLEAGKNVAYLKPQAAANDGDAAFMKNITGLKVIEKDSETAKYNGIILAEATLGNQATQDIKEQNAKVIAVEAYGGQMLKSGRAYQDFGENFLGVVINKVPASQLPRVKAEAAKKYGAAGIKVLGIIPENRMLTALSIGDLAECIGGEILIQAEKSADLVENYMLGAMVVDSGLDYFGRKKNKAAVIRKERTDMQLAALETSTACLVLSGDNQPPNYGVIYKADSKGIPVITTGAGVNEIVTNIDNALATTRLRQLKKLQKLAETVKQNLDMKVFG
jgi:BioD-like phosphotransacetylase family protein